MINNMGKVLIACVLCGSLTAGCASIVSLISEGSSSSQEISISSSPEGVRILDGEQDLGVTPLTVKVERAKNKVLMARKEGYEEREIPLGASINPWFWGNFAAGGLLGSTTDLATDASIRYEPSEYYVTLLPKRASESERQRLIGRLWARGYVLSQRRNILHDLACGGGEYWESALRVLQGSRSLDPALVNGLAEVFQSSQDPRSLIRALCLED